MALTLEALFDAYMDKGEYEEDSLDFATDIYNWFGLDEGGIGAEEFASKYSMYLPTYDPTKERLAYEDKYLSFRNAGEIQNLAEAASEELYSSEMQKISGGLGKELAMGKEMAASTGLRSGTLESALEETMESYSGKAKNIGDVYALDKKEDLNAYNVKMSDAALDYEKDIHETKQEFYDRVMASIKRLTDIGAFDAVCPDPALSVMCPDGSCAAVAIECPGYVDVCGTPNGTATDATKCEGYTSTESQQGECERTCANRPGVGEDGKTCTESCMEGGAFTYADDGTVDLDFDASNWWDENFEWLRWQENCTDANGNWICTSDDPSTEEEEGLQGCELCSMMSEKVDEGWGQYHLENVCGIRGADGESVNRCDPACCG